MKKRYKMVGPCPIKIDDTNWKCFVNSKYNLEKDSWEVKKVPYVQIVEDAAPVKH
jgi:hypothetical protein